jgi:hypothetical protein
VVHRAINDLSGHSLRKAFLLAQSLLLALQCLPSEEHLTAFHVKRMIIAQAPLDSYAWRPDIIVDNIFEIHGGDFLAPLIKLRILFLLSGENGRWTIGTLSTVMSEFGYDAETIRAAANELMQAHRRLMWTDTILRFDTPREFDAASMSSVFSSGSSKTYLLLAGDLDYVREVALDTTVGGSFSLREESGAPSIVHRLEAYLEFAHWLFVTDLSESRKFLRSAQFGLEDYSRWFGHEMLTATFLPSFLDQLMTVAERSKGKGALELQESIARLNETIKGISIRLIAQDRVEVRGDGGIIVKG